MYPEMDSKLFHNEKNNIMYKSAILVALILVGFGFANVNAQSIVDPGVSTHNYKHPQKAAKAKANQDSDKTIRVANMNTIESYYKRQNRGKYVNTTPKYAPRPATLVVSREYQVEGVDINPLVSPRNYKTPNVSETKRNYEVADSNNAASDSSSLPTVD